VADSVDPGVPQGDPAKRKPVAGKAAQANGAAKSAEDFEPADIEAPTGSASTELFDDLEALRKENALAVVDLVKTAAVVPVRRPINDEFVTVSRKPEHSFPAFLYEDPILGECYVPKTTRDAGWLGDRARPVQLHVFVSVPGEECLWPVPLPKPGIKENTYSTRQREHADAMLKREPPTWASIRSNVITKTYEITWAKGDLGEPKFTDRSMGDMLKAAFGRDCIIDRFDHPALRRIRGEPT
jgi:hypothetical protein